MHTINSIIIIKRNASDTIFFYKKFVKLLMWRVLLVNEKVILMVGLDENQ